MTELTELSLTYALLAFGIATLAVALGGIAMAGLADRLADRTGLGEAITGALFLGASTSLSGVVTSVTAALQEKPDLAMSNAVGGIAAQTVFLAIADITYRRANLEHAAASPTNLLQSAQLILLLSIPLLAFLTPEVSFLGVHPATVVILAAYIFGLRLASDVSENPLWGPRRTADTRVDSPEEPAGGRSVLASLILRFILLAGVVGCAGFVIAESGIVIAERTGLGETLVGMLLTSVATSLPELVTTLAAVRRGALTLAVSGIIGGNTFDVILVSASDIAYRSGSIFHAAAMDSAYIIALTILMTAVLLLGLVRRERYGIGNIGFESTLLIVIYVAGVVILSQIAVPASQ